MRRLGMPRTFNLGEGCGASGELEDASVRSGTACLDSQGANHQKSDIRHDVSCEEGNEGNDFAMLQNAPQSVRVSPYGVKILRLASLAHPEANANCFIAV